tara:strand:+ start:10340 stop:11314 length:975 start_codon:yes stop_codon:yes gene_type:complete
MRKNMKQNSQFTRIFNSIADNFKEKEIHYSDMDYFKNLIDKKTLRIVLKEILNDDYLLEKIANRSYTHALGFDKIVLIDLQKDLDIKNKVQLRFHIWDNKNEALSVLEAMHEHSFNFISLVLTGKLENQCFDMSEITTKHLSLIEKLKNFVSNANEKDRVFLNDQIEILEAIKLKELNSLMLDEQNLLKEYNIEKIRKLGFIEEELKELTEIQGHYVSNRISGQRTDYKHILDKYVSIKPVKVMSISAGEYYFHPYEYPHRLYYDKEILNSTVLLTTPILSNPQGGSLQRITYQKESEKGYKKLKLTKETLRKKINNYLKETEE